MRSPLVLYFKYQTDSEICIELSNNKTDPPVVQISKQIDKIEYKIKEQKVIFLKINTKKAITI